MLTIFAIGLLGFSWPEQLDWLRPHKAELTAKQMRSRNQKVRVKLYDLKRWRMTIQKDGFTGHVRCNLHAMKTLTQGRITYAQETFGFELGENVDTLNAWYRIDDQPAQRWQDLYPVLTANRIPLKGGGLVNPTGGVVLIPEKALEHAKTISIRANERSSPRLFQLKGFEQARAAAIFNGCKTKESFERETW